MAEDFLHAAQVGAALKQVRGSVCRSPCGPVSGTAPAAAIRLMHHPADGRGSTRPPFAPRNSAGPERAAASTGRPPSCQARAARSAGNARPARPALCCPCQGRGRSGGLVKVAEISPHSSLTLIPAAYSSSRMARSRRPIAATAFRASWTPDRLLADTAVAAAWLAAPLLAAAFPVASPLPPRCPMPRPLLPRSVLPRLLPPRLRAAPSSRAAPRPGLGPGPAADACEPWATGAGARIAGQQSALEGKRGECACRGGAAGDVARACPALCWLPSQPRSTPMSRSASSPHCPAAA